MQFIKSSKYQQRSFNTNFKAQTQEFSRVVGNTQSITQSKLGGDPRKRPNITSAMSMSLCLLWLVISGELTIFKLLDKTF